MRTKRISFITLFVVMIAAFAMSFVTGANVAKAEPVFAFENGAYVKLGGDGGLRFRLEMDETTANGIKENANETLYFYVASAARMSSVTDGAGAKALNTSGNAWEVAVDPDKIYLGTDAEDNEFYFANVLIDLNTLGATNGAYYTTDFVAAATVYDSSSTSYTKFVKSVSRSLQNTASASALRAGRYSEISSTYAWLGTSYPIVAQTAADYEALESVPDISSLYFEIDGVEDTEGLVDTYGTAMRSGGARSSADGRYQSFTGLKTDLDVGTVVTVTMDVYVTGDFSGDSELFWVDTVYTAGGGEVKGKTSILPSVITGESGWYSVEFTATVRNFPNLRKNTAYNVYNTTEYGNAVYIVAENYSVKAFNYKNVVITESYKSMLYGGANNTGNGYYQSYAGLKTNLAAGTAVTVEMDVYVTGTFDEYSSIQVVNDVYTVAGGESNGTSIMSTIITGDSGWHHVTFDAIVKNFSALRMNGQYTVQDTSAIGNAVYLIVQNRSEDSFNYKNVEFTEIYSMTDGVQKTVSPNGYYSAIKGIPTELALNTAVTVEMDIKITGTTATAYVNSSIYWIDSVESANNVAKTSTLIYAAPQSDVPTGWIHVSFDAAVRNFTNVTRTSEYAAFDTSACGNGIYLCAHNFMSAASFVYKNLTVTSKGYQTFMDGGPKTSGSPANYRQSIAAIPVAYGSGSLVNVTMDIRRTSAGDSYSYLALVTGVDGSGYATRSVLYSGGSYGGDAMPTLNEWTTISFDAYVFNYDSLSVDSQHSFLQFNDDFNCIYLETMNFTTTNTFDYRNVVVNYAKVQDNQKKSDNYVQSIVGLGTDIAEGTDVTVTMDIYVTGNLNGTYVDPSIKWIDAVHPDYYYATTATAVATMKTNVNGNPQLEEGKWLTITFTATVRNFTRACFAVADNNKWTSADTSKYGNAVFIGAYFFYNCSETFNYRNVTITAD